MRTPLVSARCGVYVRAAALSLRADDQRGRAGSIVTEREAVLATPPDETRTVSRSARRPFAASARLAALRSGRVTLTVPARRPRRFCDAATTCSPPAVIVATALTVTPARAPATVPRTVVPRWVRAAPSESKRPVEPWPEPEPPPEPPPP